MNYITYTNMTVCSQISTHFSHYLLIFHRTLCPLSAHTYTPLSFIFFSYFFPLYFYSAVAYQSLFRLTYNTFFSCLFSFVCGGKGNIKVFRSIKSFIHTLPYYFTSTIVWKINCRINLT